MEYLSNTTSWAPLIIILVAVAIFIIVRELVCWYYKINERITVLNNILEELKKINLKQYDK